MHVVLSRVAAGHLSVAVAACLWSLGGMFVKLLTGLHGVDPRAVACLRSATAGLVLVWALPRLGAPPRGRVGAAALAYTVVVGTFVFATAGTTAANAILLQYAYPLFVAAGAVCFLSERLGGRTLLALALGLGGVATIVVFSWTPAQRSGVALGVVSAMALAAFTLLQRGMKRGNPVALSCLYNLVAAALLLPLAWGRLSLSLAAVALVTAQGAVQLGIPYVLFIRGLRTVRATDAALITLIEPLLNPVWVWLAVREAPHWSTFAGGALILLALGVRFASARVPAPAAASE